MKLFALLCALALLPSLSHAEEMDPKQAEMMKKFQEASTPGPEHKLLEGMAGKWNYTAKFWQAENAKPETDKGTSTMKMIMGGRFLQHELKGRAMGMPYNGMGLTGFDKIKGEFNTLWIDSMGTAMMTGKGKFDDATKTLTDAGEYSCPISPTKVQDYRGEWKIIDKDNMVYSMYSAGLNIGGPKFKNMEMTFKRAK